AHGLAVQALRAAGVSGPVGIVLNPGSFLPASADPADVEAARRIDLGNKLFLDPLYKAAYDEEVLAEITRVNDGSHIRPGDCAIIATPTDYLGINYYGPERVTPDPSTAASASWPGRAGVGHIAADVERTVMGWEVEPQGLVDVINRIRGEYGADITFYITENGAAYDDEVAADGGVHDPQRTSYLRRHLLAVRRMIADGVDIRGYFVWSLLDNFEWSFGYSRRFGIVWTDYDTFERIPKDSARFYAEAARTGVVPR
ncbi:MAG: beta-glucosidase, partial [Frankiaceae bacterium]|nr:beta-glucosidase [Frankiaceae bacterium]